MIERIEATLLKLRDIKPLVLNITNYVTMDFMTNSLLALGCAPIMSVCNEELKELIKIAHAVNINIGTLDHAFIERCHLACSLAEEYQKPVALDPVGAGASLIRTNTALSLLKYASIVRGNASEIMALAHESSKTLGVESTNTTQQAKDAAIELAKQYGSTIVVSGPSDFITDESSQEEMSYGSPLMPLITGMGCTLTVVIAAFSAIVPNPFDAAFLATLYFTLCGQLAATESAQPGSFRSAFIDALYQADFSKMRTLYGQSDAINSSRLPTLLAQDHRR